MEIDKLIQKYRDAGFRVSTPAGNTVPFVTGSVYEMERFAELVASKEREACEAICDAYKGRDGEAIAEAIRARGKQEKV